MSKVPAQPSACAGGLARQLPFVGRQPNIHNDAGRSRDCYFAALVTLWANEIDLKLHPDARIYVLPCIAGHVGADTAAVLLAETPWERDEISLIIDVGTNAEIVLGNRERLLAASSPTGPAFEGAGATSGSFHGGSMRRRVGNSH